MRHYCTEKWSRYRIERRHLEDLRTQMVARAASLGFHLPREAIRIATLKDSDALRVSNGGGLQYRDYLDHPLEDRDHEDDPARVSNRIDTVLLMHLHRMRWQRLRDRAMDQAGGDTDRHYDCTNIVRWVQTMKATDTARVTEFELDYDDSLQSVGMRARITTSSGVVKMTHTSIVLPLRLPDTVCAGVTMRRLGEIMDLPSCGTPAMDDILARQYVFGAVATSNETTVSLGMGGATVALDPAGEDSDWRRLRAVRPFVQRMDADREATDFAATLMQYRKECETVRDVRDDGLVDYPAMIPEEDWSA